MLAHHPQAIGEDVHVIVGRESNALGRAAAGRCAHRVAVPPCESNGATPALPARSIHPPAPHRYGHVGILYRAKADSRMAGERRKVSAVSPARRRRLDETGDIIGSLLPTVSMSLPVSMSLWSVRQIGRASCRER